MAKKSPRPKADSSALRPDSDDAAHEDARESMRSTYQQRVKAVLSDRHDFVASDRALREFALEANHLVDIYFSNKRVRPSMVTDKLKAIAKGLRKAADAADAMGRDGFIALAVASHTDGAPERVHGSLPGCTRQCSLIEDYARHLAYMNRMARWAERAASEAPGIAKMEGDTKAGANPDLNMKPLVTSLAERFEEGFGLRNTHTIGKASHVGESAFDMCVKEALRCFAPVDYELRPAQIDDAIAHVLRRRKDIDWADSE